MEENKNDIASIVETTLFDIGPDGVQAAWSRWWAPKGKARRCVRTGQKIWA